MENLVMENFTLRISTEDKTMIAELARTMRRSKSNAIRFLISEAYSQLETKAPPSVTEPQKTVRGARSHVDK